MGIYGAGLATAIGSVISFVVMLTLCMQEKHTPNSKNTKALGQATRDFYYRISDLFYRCGNGYSYGAF